MYCGRSYRTNIWWEWLWNWLFRFWKFGWSCRRASGQILIISLKRFTSFHAFGYLFHRKKISLIYIRCVLYWPLYALSFENYTQLHYIINTLTDTAFSWYSETKKQLHSKLKIQNYCKRNCCNVFPCTSAWASNQYLKSICMQFVYTSDDSIHNKPFPLHASQSSSLKLMP